ncbi:hypothetical protein HNR46_000120 [Haloferula luteola]|uniref:PEGA domain-containing protein n=1 Tax=Haloferula luteola TaxID=595692 RepID=A0A840V805_9BACT|nr:DUF4397 domain-containing protein [Haloferula luteola]MBB5349899.1 hypothetical protein [Haloferula luteola]
MRTIFKLLAALFTLSILQAQESAPKVGFIRIVNAVAPGEGNTQILVDGEVLYPKGYKLGQRTGGIGLPPGSRRVTVRKDGVEEGSTTVNVVAGATTTLIAFAEKEETDDPEQPIIWKSKVLRLKQSDPERGYRLTVVSVCALPNVNFNVATEARKAYEERSVKRFNTQTVDLGSSRGDVVVRLRGEKNPICKMSPDQAGNYVAVFYDDPDGKVKALTFYDPKFVIAG